LGVKTITIRDLRQRWPEAEAALEVENEILITRDSKPVAKLVRLEVQKDNRPRWDVAAHARWQKKVAGGKYCELTRRSRGIAPIVLSSQRANDLSRLELPHQIVDR
jgi:antitoxin (DNA-binding transcriptional repressor) of toxin-antitoxin stability system